MQEITIKFIDLDDKFFDLLYGNFVYSNNEVKDTLLPIEQVEGMAWNFLQSGELDNDLLRELIDTLRRYQNQGIENLFIRI